MLDRFGGVKVDEAMVNRGIGQFLMVRALEEYFDRGQLDMIEAAFESFDIRGELEQEDEGAALRFYKDFRDSESRLRAIAQRIIDDPDGRFTLPADRYEVA
jgi:GNAT superfamily N-acetyltransferase